MKKYSTMEGHVIRAPLCHVLLLLTVVVMFLLDPVSSKPRGYDESLIETHDDHTPTTEAQPSNESDSSRDLVAKMTMELSSYVSRLEAAVIRLEKVEGPGTANQIAQSLSSQDQTTSAPCPICPDIACSAAAPTVSPATVPKCQGPLCPYVASSTTAPTDLLATAPTTCPDWLNKGGDLGDLIFVRTGMTWDNAQSYCGNCGGDLVILDTEAKRIEMANMAEAKGAIFYVGGNDRSGSWQWINGKSASVASGGWVPGQPDDDQADDTCLRIYTDGGSDMFKDHFCSTSWYFICQKE